jgi:lipid-A-disaccharide synthase
VGGSGERRFLIVAGEASGDAHAARLVAAMRGLGVCRVRGVTGPALAAAGAERLVAMAELSVIGFSGVLARLPRIWSAYRRLLAEARDFRPHAAVLVDSPGFNFRLGPALHRLGIPVFYYIAPQVWAWHAGRAAAMARWVSRLAVILPFEEELFRRAGVDARFVGHPLLEDLAPETDAATLRREAGVPEGGTLLGLLPGSRPQEMIAHAPVMAEAARRLVATRPGVVAALALAPGLEREVAGLGRALAGVRLLSGRTRAVQAHAACCAVASGTATLETALFGTPEAIVYRTGRLNYAIARRVVRLSHIGLPNIVARRTVAPELIQDECSPARLAATLATWLDDAAARERARAELRTVREQLGGAGASARAAAWLWELAG